MWQALYIHASNCDTLFLKPWALVHRITGYLLIMQRNKPPLTPAKSQFGGRREQCRDLHSSKLLS